MSKDNQLIEDESRAISLHEKSIVILMHDHLPIAFDIPKMQTGGITAKVYNLQGKRIDPPLIYEDVETGKWYLPRELDWAGSKIMKRKWGYETEDRS